MPTQMSTDASELLHQAWKEYNGGQITLAAHTFATASILDYTSASARFGVGVCAMHDGDSHLARDIFMSLLDSDCIDPIWLFHYAATCFDFHQFDRAAAALRRYRSLKGSLSPYEAIIHQVSAALELCKDIELPRGIDPQWMNAAKLLPLAIELPFGTRGAGIRFAIQSIMNVKGLDLEFGTWRGASAHVICKYSTGFLYCFDRLYGIKDPWSGVPANAYSCHGVKPDLPKNARLIVGSLEDSLPQFLSENSDPVRFIHFDCDTYDATRNALEIVGERLAPGSVLLFDQYFMNHDWENSEYLAMQDWLHTTGRRADILRLSPFTRQGVLVVH